MKEIVRTFPIKEQNDLMNGLNIKIRTYQENEEKLHEKRMRRLKAEETALHNSGCFYGPTFTFPVSELIV